MHTLDRLSGSIVDEIVQSWIAWSLIIAYIILAVASPATENLNLWMGGLAIVAILLGMNGLARTELWLTSRGPAWFRKHPVARVLHHIHNEGELAGIAIAGIVLLAQLHRGVHVHFALTEAFTLLGIMSAANLSVRQMMPIMSLVERFTGTWGAIVVGSFLSSLTGEPAAAVFLSEYFKHRTAPQDKERVATALGATIGSGGGLLPFSAPPILIIWAILRSTFGWGLGDLLVLVGVGCLLHVTLVAWKLRPRIQPSNASSHRLTLKDTWPLLVLAVTVGLNVSYDTHHWTLLTWGWDAAIGIAALIAALQNPRIVESEGHEQQGRGRHWQPLTLGVLLMGLEIVGTEAEPLLHALAGLIPENAPILLVALMLWYATAFTSHFADNALASRVFITVAASLTAVLGHGDLLALSVVLGALFGGFLLIPANLPNFAIAAEFGISSGGWARTAWRWYWSGIGHIVWITCFLFLG
ncbi:MAG: hypothetical protein PHZ00_02445 [Candidatus Peribacteraceae bacterium]|nr:hypothetical protein [Candidatus Peribacteraceae bacterium]